MSLFTAILLLAGADFYQQIIQNELEIFNYKPLMLAGEIMAVQFMFSNDQGIEDPFIQAHFRGSKIVFQFYQGLLFLQS